MFGYTAAVCTILILTASVCFAQNGEEHQYAWMQVRGESKLEISVESVDLQETAPGSGKGQVQVMAKVKQILSSMATLKTGDEVHISYYHGAAGDPDTKPVLLPLLRKGGKYLAYLNYQTGAMVISFGRDSPSKSGKSKSIEPTIPGAGESSFVDLSRPQEVLAQWQSVVPEQVTIRVESISGELPVYVQSESGQVFPIWAPLVMMATLFLTTRWIKLRHRNALIIILGVGILAYISTRIVTYYRLRAQQEREVQAAAEVSKPEVRKPAEIHAIVKAASRTVTSLRPGDNIIIRCVRSGAPGSLFQPDYQKIAKGGEYEAWLVKAGGGGDDSGSGRNDAPTYVPAAGLGSFGPAVGP